MHEEFAYYNEHIRCYRSGKIETDIALNGRVSKNGIWREVKPTDIERGGYVRLRLPSTKGKNKREMWHRVIWVAFNGEIPNGLQVNHRDEIKTNNSLDNLELLAPKENDNYGTRNERISKAKTNGKTSKPVVGIHVKTGDKIEFPSVNEAGRNGFDTGAVGHCCNGDYGFKSHKGYRWYYKDDLDLTV